MADSTAELNERFERYAGSGSELRPEVLGELQSMLRLYSISPEELFFKWEAYSIKMGGENVNLDLKTTRDFKKDIQDGLERESRGKAQARHTDKRAAPTPRAGGKNSDVFGMLDGLVPNTPRPGATNGVNGSTIKRKSNFDTPASKAAKSHPMSSPSGVTPISDGVKGFNFAERAHAGDISEQLNGHIEIPETPEEPPTQSRMRLKANTDMSKFNYKTMAMKLSEASEVLDDRIDEFLALVQEHDELENSAFGNPAYQSTSEIIAVGRIASDTAEGKLNTASLVLETSRRTGAGLRVPLRVESVQSYNFFPGQIVALRGTNASGDYFTVTEVLDIPLLGVPGSKPEQLDAFNASLLDTPDSDPSNPRPLQILVASGPYTTDTNLDFAPLHALLDQAATSFADAIIMTGPFLDAEHPQIRAGDFDIPPHVTSPDTATMADLFRHFITAPIQKFIQRLPTCSIIMVPSLRDATSRHATFPQDKFVKKELGLPKQVQCVTNPMMLSMNEFVFGMSSIDILDMLRREECVGGRAKAVNIYERAARNVIEQRSFLPVFPPTGREKLAPVAGVDEKMVGGEDGETSDERGPWLPLGTMVDTSYLKLGEWLNVRPDVLVTPSVLNPCVKVVESVLVINPGTLSKRRAAGTYARLTILPASVSDEERAAGVMVGHKLWERARVDIVKI